jgi:hypothetical protein
LVVFGWRLSVKTSECYFEVMIIINVPSRATI